MKKLLITFAILDVVAAGMGMGVPIFCILLSGVFGWMLIDSSKKTPDLKQLKNAWLYAGIGALFTAAIMLVCWLHMILMLFDPATDYANYGLPLFLYDPKLSFIGWIILMIIISPILQFMFTVTAAVGHYLKIKR